jgi:hypothetical protein
MPIKVRVGQADAVKYYPVRVVVLLSHLLLKTS